MLYGLESYRVGDKMPRNHGALDPSVGDRVSREIDTFTKALETAKANPTPSALSQLEQSADRLMRATGRVLIELGRLCAESG